MGQIGVDRQLCPNLGCGWAALAAVFGYRLADQPYVEVETDVGDVPGLLTAEQVARAADLQILHRHLHACAELRMGRDRRQPLVRLLGQRNLRWIEEVGIRTFPATAHPTTELVQLGEAEPVRPVDDERVRVGDVQAGLHDGGADQDVSGALPEIGDDLFKRARPSARVR